MFVLLVIYITSTMTARDYTVQTLELKLKVSEFGQYYIFMTATDYTVQTLKLKLKVSEFGQK